MTEFLWTMIVICALIVVGNLSLLAKRQFPTKTPQSCAVDIAINVCLIVWAATLLT